MKSDLTDAFCKGMKSRFGGFPCEHYDPSAEECHLLRKGKAGKIFKSGRCEPLRMLRSAISRYLKTYENLVFREEKTDQNLRNEYANFIFDRLSTISVNLKKGYTLPNLIGYIRKAARNEVLSILGKEHLHRKTCGKCLFLSLTMPRVCQRQEILLTREGKESRAPNPYYNQKRGASDRACKNGFKAFESDVPLPDETADETENETEKIFHKLEVGDIERLLSGRTAKTRSTKRMYIRQHAVFTKFYQLLSDGLEPGAAITHIAKLIGVSERTVRNDLSAIKEFLKKNIS